jgi:hypothetical protein
MKDLDKALLNEVWVNHSIGDDYSIRGDKDIWKISYYPIFENGKTNEQYDEPRALIEKPIYGKLGEKIGTDFRETPLRYLTKL